VTAERRVLVAACIVAFAVLVGACSSPQVTCRSMPELARAIGCEGYTPGEAAGPGTNYREMGTCTIDGEQATLYTFNTNDARDSWRRVAPTGIYFAGTSYYVAITARILDVTANKIEAPIRSNDPD